MARKTKESRMETNMASEAEIENLRGKLKKIGWHITPEGVAKCCEALGKGKYTEENIIKSAVNFDLKEIVSSVLTEDVKRGRAMSIEGPIVLQIQKIRNVSAPKANEESAGAPRMLKIQLTDGHTTFFALENMSIQQLSLSTPPGTKVRLKGIIPMLIGFVLLEPGRVEKIGGKVEKLLTKWETNRNITEQRALAGIGSEGPPLFVPFDVKTSGSFRKTPNDKTLTETKEPSIKPETGTNDVGERVNKKTQDNFTQNRNQRVNSVKGDGKDRYSENRGTKRNECGRGNISRQAQGRNENKNYKTTEPKRSYSANDKSQVRGIVGAQAGKAGQSGYKKNTKDEKQGKEEYQDERFSKSREQRGDREKNDGRKRNDKRGGRYDEDGHNQESRPSEGTLWDFLEKRFPIKESKKENEGQISGSFQEDRFPKSSKEQVESGKQERRQSEMDVRKNKDGRKIADVKDTTNDTVIRENKGQKYVKQNEKPRNETAYSKEASKKDLSKKPYDKTRGNQGYDSGNKKGYNQDNFSDKRRAAAGSEYQGPPYKNEPHRNKNVSQMNSSKTVENYDRNETSVDRKGQEGSLSKQRGGTGRNQDWNKNQKQGAKHRDFDRKDTGGRGSGINGAGQPKWEKDKNDQVENNLNVNKKNPSRREYDQKQSDVGMNRKHDESLHGEPAESDRRTGKGKSEQQYGGGRQGGSFNAKAEVVQSQGGAGGKTGGPAAQGGGRSNEKGRLSDRSQERSVDQRMSSFDVTSSQENMQFVGNERHHRFQHWWKKGEQCMALCSIDYQYHPANILSVEVHIRSCLVFFDHSKTTETVQWSNLSPLDVSNHYNNHNMFSNPRPTNPSYFHQGPSLQYAVKGGWIPPQRPSHQPYFVYETQPFHHNPGPGGPNSRPRLARPTQSFYTPPSRSSTNYN